MFCRQRPIDHVDPTGLAEWTQETHASFQRLIDEYSILIDFNATTPCAAFARLFSLLYEATGKDEALSSVYALYYLSSTKNTIYDTLKGLPGLNDGAPWSNTWAPPSWASTHSDQGSNTGYIQLPGDIDDTGRHDHFLSNFYAIATGRGAGDLGARITGLRENSPTDKLVNSLGRELAHRMKSMQMGFLGKKMSGEEVHSWVYNNLCKKEQPEKCGSNSGQLTDRKAKELIGRLVDLKNRFGSDFYRLPWDKTNGLPAVP